MGIEDTRTNDLIDERRALQKEFPPGAAGRKAYKARQRCNEIAAELRRREQAAKARKRKGGR